MDCYKQVSLNRNSPLILQLHNRLTPITHTQLTGSYDDEGRVDTAGEVIDSLEAGRLPRRVQDSTHLRLNEPLDRGIQMVGAEDVDEHHSMEPVDGAQRKGPGG